MGMSRVNRFCRLKATCSQELVEGKNGWRYKVNLCFLFLIRFWLESLRLQQKHEHLTEPQWLLICCDCYVSAILTNSCFYMRNFLHGGFKYFLNVNHDPGGNDPIWPAYMCQLGWNHHLVIYELDRMFSIFPEIIGHKAALRSIVSRQQWLDEWRSAYAQDLGPKDFRKCFESYSVFQKRSMISSLILQMMATWNCFWRNFTYRYTLQKTMFVVRIGKHGNNRLFSTFLPFCRACLLVDWLSDLPDSKILIYYLQSQKTIVRSNDS